MAVTPVYAHRITPHQAYGQRLDIVAHGSRVEQARTCQLVTAPGARTPEAQLPGGIVTDVIAAPRDDDLRIVTIYAFGDWMLHRIRPIPR